MTGTQALTYILLTDGTSDRVLIHHLDWLLKQHTDAPINGQWVDLGRIRKKSATLVEHLQLAHKLYSPYDLVFVHRDAEGDTIAKRKAEISSACALAYPASATVLVICLVPVRMQEAWLLFDEQAIRKAAGNPRGKVKLTLPRLHSIETEPNPKQILNEMLRDACELSGRRLARFRAADAAQLVGEYIEDFSPLRALSAFRQLESDIVSMITAHAW